MIMMSSNKQMVCPFFLGKSWQPNKPFFWRHSAKVFKQQSPFFKLKKKTGQNWASMHATYPRILSDMSRSLPNNILVKSSSSRVLHDPNAPLNSNNIMLNKERHKKTWVHHGTWKSCSNKVRILSKHLYHFSGRHRVIHLFQDHGMVSDILTSHNGHNETPRGVSSERRKSVH